MRSNYCWHAVARIDISGCCHQSICLTHITDHSVPRSAATSENSKGVFHESLSILVEQGTDVVVVELLGRRRIRWQNHLLTWNLVTWLCDQMSCCKRYPSVSYLRLWDIRERRSLASMKFDPKKDTKFAHLCSTPGEDVIE